MVVLLAPGTRADLWRTGLASRIHGNPVMTPVRAKRILRALGWRYVDLQREMNRSSAEQPSL